MMAELEVIYDPAKELAAIINVDDRCGWGPAMLGPQAGQILQAFLDTAPFDLSLLSTYDATRAFTSFLESSGLAAPPAGAEGDTVAPQSDGGGSMDYPDRLAEAEAAGATDVPAPGPADTDAPEGASTSPTVIDCPNCQGSGEQTNGETGAVEVCGMCQGKRQLTIAA
jgi:hypothetical protein